MDFHNGKKRFERRSEKLRSLPSSKAKDALLKYLEYHESILGREQMSYLSALRSIEIAEMLAKWKGFFDEEPYSVEAVKGWWCFSLERNSKQSNRKISPAGLQKLQTQATKFLKFLDFLHLGEDFKFFNLRREPSPKAARYFVFDSSPKRKEIKRLDIAKFKEMIDLLMSSPKFYDRLAGVMAVFCYDTGCRFSEAASLRNSSLQYENDYILASLEDSKTFTRTNVCILSCEFLVSWQRFSPTKDNPDGFLFCSRLGSFVPYDKVCFSLKRAAEKVGFVFPDGKLWHYLRHEFASRAYEMPENLIRYYLGWSNGGIRATYSHYSYKDCLLHLYKMNEGYPMLNKPLSFLDAGKKEEFQSKLEQMVEEKVLGYLKNQKT